LHSGVEILRTGPRSFLLFDRQSGKQCELGAEERFLLHALELAGAPDDARQEFVRHFGRELPRRQLEEFLEQLRKLGVLDDAASQDSDDLPELPLSPHTLLRTSSRARLNTFFDLLAVFFGWLLHPVWTIPVFLMGLQACLSMVRQWPRFINEQHELWTRFPFLPLVTFQIAQTVVFLNIPRTLFVGMACRLLGGRVREYRFILWEGLVPAFQVDVGDSPALMNNRKRWTLYVSDLWFQIALAAAYTLVWAASRPGSGLGKLCLMAVIPALAALFTQCVIFFDGAAYYGLCAACGDWKLRGRALAETAAWLAWRPSPEPLSATQRWWLRSYGVGYYLFRFLFEPVLLLTTANWLIGLFHGTGAAAAIVVLIWWYHRPLGKLLLAALHEFVSGLGRLASLARMPIRGDTMWLSVVRWGGSPWVFWPLRLAMITTAVGIGFLPYNYEVQGECRVLPGTQYAVHAEVADEITKIHFVEGDFVKAGDRIVTLSAREANKNYFSALASLEKALSELDLLKAGYRQEDIKIAEERFVISKTNLAYWEQQLRREDQMVGTGAASVEQYQKVKQQFDDAKDKMLQAKESFTKLKNGYREEEIKAVESQVRGYEEQLHYCEDICDLCKINTTVSGKVTSAYMPERKGQYTKLGAILAVIEDDSTHLIEIAADDPAALDVKVGMPVKIRLYSLWGRLLTGRVSKIAPGVEINSKYGNDPVATDSSYQEQNVNNRLRNGASHIRIYVELDEYPPGLSASMSGYARIIVDDKDVLWRAVARPIVRFIRTEVWSWLP
jgi:multidrug resistance efflux pump